MSHDKVFLHYTQAELDRNYDQRTWAKDANYYIGRYPVDSAAARSSLAYRSFAYGADADETLDIFLSKPGASTVFFVHGGAWRNFNKTDFSYLAKQFVRAGYHFAIPNFSKLPNRRLPEVVEQLRKAAGWLHANSEQFGGAKPFDLYIVGHSSGAHLSALLLTTDWPGYNCPADMVKGAALISGSYDLEPALLSKRGAYISVTEQEKRALSPMFLTDKVGCPVLVASAENDTDEFKRQSNEFSRLLRREHKLFDVMCLPEIGHFAVLDELYKDNTALLRAVVGHIGKSIG